MCSVFSKLKRCISNVLHWCCAGVSLVSQREVNGKLTESQREVDGGKWHFCGG